jgi:hypothetical protein
MKKELAWVCGECERECWPIRSESRCLCGHRLKDHHACAAADGAGAPRTCNGRGCACRGFFFVPAEGAWTLRCRCKHKAVEHCAVTHACTRCKGSSGSIGGAKDGGGSACARFDSPWMCNCDHGWAAHRQVEVGACGGSGGSGGGGISSTNTGEAGNNSGSEESALTAAAAVAAAAAAELEQMCVVMRGRDAA